MKSKNSKTVTIKALHTKQRILDEVYTLLESTYKNIEGGLNLKINKIY